MTGISLASRGGYHVTAQVRGGACGHLEFKVPASSTLALGNVGVAGDSYFRHKEGLTSTLVPQHLHDVIDIT